MKREGVCIRLVSVLALGLFLGMGVLSCGGGVGGGGGTSDTVAPSIPSNLQATAMSKSQIDLTWSASTDNVGVAGYEVFRGPTSLGKVTATSYSDTTGLLPATEYTYTVKAYDGANNFSDPSSPATAETQHTATYLYYFNRTTGGLFFYDPATKAITTVEAGGITGGEDEFIGGTYYAAATELTDLHFNTMVYAKGGKLYKVSLVKNGTPTPVQVSSKTGASTVCNNQDIPDLANPGNSIYAYELPGIDGFCYPPDDTGDNVWKAVRLSMTSGDAPMEITSLGMEPVSEIRDWSTAGIGGELAVDHLNDALVKCTTDFTSQNCTNLLGKPTHTIQDAGSLGVDINAKKIYLWVLDGAEYQVRTYDTVNDIISDPVYTTANPISEGLQDSNALYFGENYTLKKITFGSTPVVVPLFTETLVVNARLTDNRIVYVSKNVPPSGPTTYTLKSALKSDGATTVLATAIDPAYVNLVIGTGNSVFYTIVSGSTTAIAGYIKDDGAGQYEVPNALWSGGSVFTTMTAPSEGSPDKLIMSNLNDGTVRSFDAATYSSASTGIFLGAMPYAEGMKYFTGGSFGNDILGVGVNTSGQGDIFSVNVNTVDSLYRVTNTTDDERLSRWGD